MFINNYVYYRRNIFKAFGEDIFYAAINSAFNSRKTGKCFTDYIITKRVERRFTITNLNDLDLIVTVKFIAYFNA